MSKPQRVRPSQRPSFKLFAFSAGVLIFVVGYWMGNRYKVPNIPGLSATLVHPAQQLPRFTPLFDNSKSELTDEWHLLYMGIPDQKTVRVLYSSYNRLAYEPEMQKRFKARFISPGNTSIPQFAVQFRLDTTELNQLTTALGLATGDKGLFLINPQGELIAIFTNITSPSVIANDYKAILEYF